MTVHDVSTVDLTIHIRKGNAAQPAASLNRSLVMFLCEVQETGSVQEACNRLNCSTRQAQRALKHFSDVTGINLLSYHGPKGTELTPAGMQCIALYGVSLQSLRRIVRKQGLPKNPAFMDLCVTCEDGHLKFRKTEFQTQAEAHSIKDNESIND